MLKLVIGNKNYSSWSMRPWLAMRANDIAFEEVFIPLYTDDKADKDRILSFSRAGKVPALIDGDDGKAADLAEGWIYAGYRMTVFSASEEKVAEAHLLKGELPFDMPKALTLAGGEVSVTATDFASNVVVDRELITGQNPASDHALAKALIEALGRSAVRA